MKNILHGLYTAAWILGEIVIGIVWCAIFLAGWVLVALIVGSLLGWFQ